MIRFRVESFPCWGVSMSPFIKKWAIFDFSKHILSLIIPLHDFEWNNSASFCSNPIYKLWVMPRHAIQEGKGANAAVRTYCKGSSGNVRGSVTWQSVAWQLVYLCYTWKSVHCGASRISSVCIYYGNCHIHIISRPNGYNYMNYLSMMQIYCQACSNYAWMNLKNYKINNVLIR